MAPEQIKLRLAMIDDMIADSRHEPDIMLLHEMRARVERGESAFETRIRTPRPLIKRTMGLAAVPPSAGDEPCTNTATSPAPAPVAGLALEKMVPARFVYVGEIPPLESEPCGAD